MRTPLDGGKWRGRKFYAAARGRPPIPSSAHPSLTYRLPGHLRLLKTSLTTLVALAGVTVLYVVFWFSVAASLRDDVTAWAEARRAEGYTVDYAKLEMSGFPLWLHATATAPVLAPPESAGAWHWQGQILVAKARPWVWNAVTLEAPGSHVLTLPGTDGAVTYRGKAEQLVLDLAFTKGKPGAVALHLGKLDLKPDRPGPALSVDRADVSARRTFAAAKEGSVSLEMHLRGSGIALPLDARALPLGTVIQDLALDADLTGPYPERLEHADLAAWRDGGGTLEVRHLAAAYGPLDLTTNGTLALDDAMQPVGAFTAKAEGFFQAIDLLEKNGVMRSRDAVTAKLVLSALAKRPTRGGRPSLSIPLTLQDRRFYAGPVPLLTFDAIAWPGTPPEGPQARRDTRSGTGRS